MPLTPLFRRAIAIRQLRLNSSGSHTTSTASTCPPALCPPVLSRLVESLFLPNPARGRAEEAIKACSAAAVPVAERASVLVVALVGYLAGVGGAGRGEEQGQQWPGGEVRAVMFSFCVLFVSIPLSVFLCAYVRACVRARVHVCLSCVCAYVCVRVALFLSF